MPSIPLNVTRRYDRFSGQRWLLDAVVHAVGPEWDQYRFGAWGGVCGHDTQGVFIGLRTLVKTYNDLARECMKAARGLELRAHEDLKRGHDWAARENFFTASVLYGGAQWPIEANTPLNIRLNKKKTDNYASFIKLAGRHVEQLEVPFDGGSVPAILSLPLNYRQGEKVPCAVFISGMDGFKEVSVAMDGDKFLQRGIAVLAIDGPGQGESLTRSIWFDPETYGKLGPAAYEFAAARPEIDAKRIVAYGLSYGSYWVASLVAAEPRFLACAVAMTCFEPDGFSIFETASPTFNMRFMYMTGARDETEVTRIRQTLAPATKIAPRIKCPFFVAVGEDDQLTDLGYTFEFLNSLGGTKTVMVYEGESHDIHGTRSGELGPPAYTAAAEWLSDRTRGFDHNDLYVEVDTNGQVHEEPWGAGKRVYSYGIIETTKKHIFGDEW